MRIEPIRWPRIQASIDLEYYAKRQAEIAELQRRLFAGVGEALTNLAREFLPRIRRFNGLRVRARRRRMHSMYARRRR